MNYRKYAWLAVGVFMQVSVGCQIFGSYGGYKQIITAHLRREAIDSAHSEFLRTMGFKGFSIEWTNLTCMNYVKRLVQPRSVNVRECWSPEPGSNTEWVYEVEIATLFGGFREDIRAEMDSLAAQIKRAIEEAIPEAKVTVQSRALSSPM